MTREEAIQILADLIDNPFLHTWEEQNKALHMAIEALSAEAVQEWIPVSERLPEWWETEEGYLDTIPVLVFYEETHDAFHQMAVGEYVGRWEVWDDYAPQQDPVAWMPLPEPYKGGDTE